MWQLILKSSVVIFAGVLLTGCEKMKQERPKQAQTGVSKALDLSLDLEIEDANTATYALQGRGDRKLQGLFKPRKGVSNVEWDAHFETAHQENKEKAPLYDGVGVEVKVGI